MRRDDCGSFASRPRAGLAARARRGAQLQRLPLGRHTYTYFLVEGVAWLILGVVFILPG